MLLRSIMAGTAIMLFASVSPGIAQDAEGAGGPDGPAAVVTCNGGAQEFVGTLTQNVPTSTASAVAVVIPDTTIACGASGAAGDLDLYTITFGGEAAATSGGFWTAQAQVSVNGGAFTAINPTGPNTFHRGNKAETNSMTWCVRLAAIASTTFRIVWAKSGGGTANLDDYIMRCERSN
jgi:hypothetical protein